jgi:potassium-dependent mechanosensitive channel
MPHGQLYSHEPPVLADLKGHRGPYYRNDALIMTRSLSSRCRLPGIFLWSLLLAFGASAQSGLLAQEKPAAAAVPDSAAATDQTTTPGGIKASSPPAVRTPAVLDDLREPLSRLTEEMREATKAVDRDKDDDEALALHRPQIEKISEDALVISKKLEPRLNDVRKQIFKLGPAPAEGAPREAARITSERKRLNTVSAEISGAVKSTELLRLRSRQLLARIQDLRHANFRRSLLKRTDSPLMPAVWTDVGVELPSGYRLLSTILANWWSAVRETLPLFILLCAVTVLLYLGLKQFAGQLSRRTLRFEPVPPPTFFERAARAGLLTPVYALPGVAALLTLTGGLGALNLLRNEMGQLAETALPAAFIFVSVRALSKAILQPARPAWRLVDISCDVARRFYLILSGIAAVYAIDLILKELCRLLYLPLSVRVAEASIASLAFGGLLLALVALRFGNGTVQSGEDADGAASDSDRSWIYPRLLKIPLLMAALGILGASLLGYVALGRFMAAQIVEAGSIAALVFLAYLAIRAMVGDTSGEGPATRLIGDYFGLQEDTRDTLASFLRFILNVCLVLLALPLVFLSWGQTLIETLTYFKDAAIGFEFAGFQISPVRILLGIALFLALLFATRIFQRYLGRRLRRPTSKIEPSIVNSVTTTVGYAGFAAAALLSISYAGFDVSNLALVAGALSVGIGFGLQSIVSNFVSGLILLFERPIRVGDWVVVNDYEGYVRRISVRSTEIETFDRATVIVPNADLISGAVTNWTRRNALGRVTVAVGASYDSDPEEVRDVLLKAADDCPRILREPKPFVVFEDFGASSLDFTLRAVTGEVTSRLSIATELRMSILKGFREAGIEIPFPQQDLHLRDLDAVRDVLTRMASERAAQSVDNSEPGGTPPGEGKPAKS